VTAVIVPDTAAQREQRPAQPQRVARGNARLTGTVRGPDGRPLQGAKVVVWGTGLTGEAGPNGTFGLTGLPSGTYSIEVRAIGFQPKRTAVNLSSARPAQVALVLDDRINQLESVVVRDRKADPDITGFADRKRRGGFGRYFDEDDIAQRNAFQVSDVLRTTPGMRVSPRGDGRGYSISGRGNCTPTVFVDGMPVFDGATDLDQIVRPQELMGIEVYNGTAGIPPQFAAQAGGCGAVVVWTKRGPSKPRAAGN
jgi:hypothetical protein